MKSTVLTLTLSKAAPNTHQLCRRQSSAPLSRPQFQQKRNKEATKTVRKVKSKLLQKRHLQSVALATPLSTQT